MSALPAPFFYRHVYNPCANMQRSQETPRRGDGDLGQQVSLKGRGRGLRRHVARRKKYRPVQMGLLAKERRNVWPGVGFRVPTKEEERRKKGQRGAFSLPPSSSLCPFFLGPKVGGRGRRGHIRGKGNGRRGMDTRKDEGGKKFVFLFVLLPQGTPRACKLLFSLARKKKIESFDFPRI